MKLAITGLLAVQVGLIALSATIIAGGLGEPKPYIVGLNVALIFVNAAFGFVNVRNLCR